MLLEGFLSKMWMVFSTVSNDETIPTSEIALAQTRPCRPLNPVGPTAQDQEAAPEMMAYMAYPGVQTRPP